MQRLDLRRAALTGLAALPVGALLVVLALAVDSLPLFVLGAVVGGPPGAIIGAKVGAMLGGGGAAGSGGSAGTSSGH